MLTDEEPPGFAVLRRETVVGRADEVPRLGALVLDWAVQRRSGIDVRGLDGGNAPAVAPGAEGRVVIPLLAAGAVRLDVAAPFRVVRVLDDEDAVGFAYAALPGHPEVGEESFVVRRRGEEAVFELRALSRPRFPYSLVAPVGRAMQAVFAERYLTALLR